MRVTSGFTHFFKGVYLAVQEYIPIHQVEYKHNGPINKKMIMKYYFHKELA